MRTAHDMEIFLTAWPTADIPHKSNSVRSSKPIGKSWDFNAVPPVSALPSRRADTGSSRPAQVMVRARVHHARHSGIRDVDSIMTLHNEHGHLAQ